MSVRHAHISRFPPLAGQAELMYRSRIPPPPAPPRVSLSCCLYHSGIAADEAEGIFDEVNTDR